MSECEGVEYRVLEDFPNYRVGNDGSIWSNHVHLGGGRMGTGPWKQLKGQTNRSGHRALNCGRTTDNNRFYIHELVAKYFIGPRPEGMIIRHLDGNPGNNFWKNLAYGSCRDNWEDSVGHGTAARGPGIVPVGSKLGVDDVLTIVQLVNEGMPRSDVAALYDVTTVNISAIMTGRSWSEFTGIVHVPSRAPNPRAGKSRSILSNQQVVEIRNLYAEGWMIQNIAAVFDVKSNTISSIVNNKSRTKIPEGTQPSQTVADPTILNRDAVAEIQRLYASWATVKQLASKYRVSQEKIREIIDGNPDYTPTQLLETTRGS